MITIILHSLFFQIADEIEWGACNTYQGQFLHFVENHKDLWITFSCDRQRWNGIKLLQFALIHRPWFEPNEVWKSILRKLWKHWTALLPWYVNVDGQYVFKVGWKWHFQRSNWEIRNHNHNSIWGDIEGFMCKSVSFARWSNYNFQIHRQKVQNKEASRFCDSIFEKHA